MGKNLIIKGADFHQNAIDNITPSGDVDMTSRFSFTPGFQIFGAPNPTQSKQGVKKESSSTNNFSASDYVEIPTGVTQLRIVCVVRKYTEGAFTGLAFYSATTPEPTANANPTVVGGEYYTDNTVETGYTAEKTISVPNGARYIRTTIFGDGSTLGSNTIPFHCIGVIQ